MTRQHCITLYKFAELSKSAQANAIDACRHYAVDDQHWYEYTFDDAKRMGALFGIEVKDILFTGFASQGDGACITGYYKHVPGGLEALKAEAPQDTALHAVAQLLEDVQRDASNMLCASITHRDRYYHARSADIAVSRMDEDEHDTTDAQAEVVAEALRDFMDWIYATLEKEHEYQTSDEQVREMIEANEYEFTEDGARH